MNLRIGNKASRTKERPHEGDHPIRRDPYREGPEGDDLVTQEGDLRVAVLPVMQIAAPAFLHLMADLTTRSPEAGGILVGPQDHDAVTHYFPDETGDGTPVSFTFDHLRINRLLEQLAPAKLDAKGIVHSHPAGCSFPSGGDLAYVAQCFALADAISLPRFLLPIVCGQQIYPYVVLHDRPKVALFSQIVLF